MFNEKIIYLFLYLIMLTYAWWIVTSKKSVLGFFKNFFQKNGLISQKEEYQIIAWLQDLDSVTENKGINTPIEYKFFTQIIKSLIELRRRHGVNIRYLLMEIREEIEKDFHFENKLKEFYLGSIYQLFLILVILWGNLFIYNRYLNFLDLLSKKFIILYIALPFLVNLIFFVILIKVKKRDFWIFNQVFKNLYQLKGASFSSLPVSFFKLNMNELFIMKTNNKRFSFILKRLEASFKNFQQRGESIKEDLELIINDLWRSKNHAFDSYIKKCNVLKLLVIAFFYLPLFFYCMFEAILSLKMH